MFRKIFSRKPEPEPEGELVVECIPSLVTMLTQAERSKGSPLTEEDVVSISGRAIGMTMARERRDAKWLAQGYRDIRCENAWSDWQRYKADPDSFKLP